MNQEHRWSKREFELIRAMRKLGYACNAVGSSFIVSEIPIQPFTNCSGAIHQSFKSIQSAADWLCPIVRDSEFTALVVGECEICGTNHPKNCCAKDGKD